MLKIRNNHQPVLIEQNREIKLIYTLRLTRGHKNAKNGAKTTKIRTKEGIGTEL
jgi:hypothetical protein